MESKNEKSEKKPISKILIVAILLLLAYIILSIISLNYSIESKTTNTISNGKIITHEVLDYPFTKRVIEIFSNLFLTALIGIFISILVTNTIERQRAEQEAKSLELQKVENEKQLKELNSKINESVFDALFKRIIPKEIFHVIKRDIINSDVVRRDSEWFLDFTVVNNEISLKFTQRYKAYNNCDKEIVNPVIRMISNQRNTVSQIEKVLCTLHDDILVSYDTNNQESNSGVRVEYIDENTQKIHYELKIPAYHFVEYTTVFNIKYTEFVQDEFFTVLPQIDLSIIATYPPEYNFRIFPLMSSELKLKLKESNRSIYKVEGGILPNQGIVYYLEKI